MCVWGGGRKLRGNGIPATNYKVAKNSTKPCIHLSHMLSEIDSPGVVSVFFLWSNHPTKGLTGDQTKFRSTNLHDYKKY